MRPAGATIAGTRWRVLGHMVSCVPASSSRASRSGAKRWSRPDLGPRSCGWSGQGDLGIVAVRISLPALRAEESRGVISEDCGNWKTGRLEEWKSGRVEEWKTGRVEDCWVSVFGLWLRELEAPATLALGTVGRARRGRRGSRSGAQHGAERLAVPSVLFPAILSVSSQTEPKPPSPKGFGASRGGFAPRNICRSRCPHRNGD
jgi:hypothetical protein